MQTTFSKLFEVDSRLAPVSNHCADSVSKICHQRFVHSVHKIRKPLFVHDLFCGKKKKNSKLIFQLQFFAAAAAADELSWGSSRPRARGRRKTNSFCNSLLQAWTKAARLVKSRLITRQTFAVRGSFRGVRVVSPLKPKHRDTDSSTKAL